MTAGDSWLVFSISQVQIGSWLIEASWGLLLAVTR
jgi:hypothetical protein